MTAAVADGVVTIAPKDESQRARAMWGTTRALVNNMVTVSRPGSPQSRDQWRRLSRLATGQHAQPAARLQPRHQLSDPPDVRIACERPTLIAVSGADRQRVGQWQPRSARSPPRAIQRQGDQVQRRNDRRKEGKKK